MSFVPKVILGGKVVRDEFTRAAPAKLNHIDMIDINRLSQAFFRIQSSDIRQRVIVFIEEVAEAEYAENRL